MKTNLVGSVAMALILGACANGGRVDERTREAAAAEQSPAAADVAEAERALDRGDDGARFVPLLDKALAGATLSANDKSRAVLALSRAVEAADREKAIKVIEDEIAAHADDHDWTMSDRFHARLRKLLTGHESVHDLRLESNEPVAPFAHVLLHYFPPTSTGSVQAKFFMAGGDSDVSDRLGTYNLRGALRAEKEKECPLCDLDVNVGKSTRQSSWFVIPESQSKFGEAMTVFYFDLGRGRIPERYEAHLPMKVADIVKELEAGKSFAVAKDRPGAPPALLIAAPREAMLADAEAKLAQLTELPTTPVYFDVTPELRPAELHAVLNSKWKAGVRACYKTLLAGRDDARGHADIKMELDAAGRVTEASVQSKDETLRDPTFVACVSDATRAQQFPAGGRPLTVVVPLELHQ